jgi:outer membrane biosynthesis protein TonB
MRVFVGTFFLLLSSLCIQAQAVPAASSNPTAAETEKAKTKANSGGVEILSDTQGVDFSKWLESWHRITQLTWIPLLPDIVNPPRLEKGQVVIRFKVLPNGRVMNGSMMLEGRSGSVSLDRAAWGAITGSDYPPLPHDFHGPYLELRAWFLYNMEPASR